MKKLLGTLVFAAALMVGAAAQAAPVDIIASSSDGTNWTLELRADVQVAAIAITLPETALFTINTANTAIAAMGGGSSFGAGATAGLFSLNLNPATCAGVNCTPFNVGQIGNSVLLGTFVLSGALVDNSPYPGPRSPASWDDGSVGGTAFTSVLDIIPDDQIDVRNVPEPMSAVMLGLGLAALGLVRRKAA